MSFFLNGFEVDPFGKFLANLKDATQRAFAGNLSEDERQDLGFLFGDYRASGASLVDVYTAQAYVTAIWSLAAAKEASSKTEVSFHQTRAKLAQTTGDLLTERKGKDLQELEIAFLENEVARAQHDLQGSSYLMNDRDKKDPVRFTNGLRDTLTKAQESLTKAKGSFVTEFYRQNPGFAAPTPRFCSANTGPIIQKKRVFT